jgi:hypothetical protein
MGTDCKITFPGDVRADDAAKVIGILLGCEKHWTESGNARWVDVDNAKVGHTSMPKCAEITAEGPMGTVRALWHFEFGEGASRGMLPTSRPTWIAIARRMVEFFGGKVDYQDTDAVEVNYSAKKPRKVNNPSDDKAWDDFHNELWQLKPLTKAEIEKCRKLAGYPEAD